LVKSGASVTTVNGNLTLNANQQVTPTSGNFVGVQVNGLIHATGKGTVTVQGKGGTGGVISVPGDPGDGTVDVNGLPQDFSLTFLPAGTGGNNSRGLASIYSPSRGHFRDGVDEGGFGPVGL
jgi:hypothetical protein